MSTPMLLTYPTDERARNLFAFDHDKEHSILGGQSGPETLSNYFLDPAHRPELPAGPWLLRHQMAHNDAANALAVQPSLMLIEGSPQDEWWLWTNHWEHMALSGALLSQG